MVYNSEEVKDPSFIILEDDVLTKMVFKKSDGSTLVVPLADLGDIEAVKSALSGTYAGDAELAALLDPIIVGAITRDADGAALTAGVVWPDGTAGVYTATSVSEDFPGAVDAYTVTKPPLTFTQPAVTRDPTSGAVTIRPAMTVA